MEDIFITIAMLCSTAFTVLTKLQANDGMGLHEWELTEKELLKPLKVT